MTQNLDTNTQNRKESINGNNQKGLHKIFWIGNAVVKDINEINGQPQIERVALPREPTDEELVASFRRNGYEALIIYSEGEGKEIRYRKQTPLGYIH